MTTCFSCQNLLSDYVEGILPSSRHEDLKKHLDECKKCSHAHKDMTTALGLLTKLKWQDIPNEVLLQAAAAAESGRYQFFTKRRVVRIGIGAAVPFVVLLIVSFIFPTLLPWSRIFGVSNSGSQFIRYFPLTQGATEIIEEQSQLLHSREPFAGSLWEEGGLSPEDFEKTFKVGGGSGGSSDTEP